MNEADSPGEIQITDNPKNQSGFGEDLSEVTPKINYDILPGNTPKHLNTSRETWVTITYSSPLEDKLAAIKQWEGIISGQGLTDEGRQDMVSRLNIIKNTLPPEFR